MVKSIPRLLGIPNLKGCMQKVIEDANTLTLRYESEESRKDWKSLMAVTIFVSVYLTRISIESFCKVSTLWCWCKSRRTSESGKSCHSHLPCKTLGPLPC